MVANHNDCMSPPPLEAAPGTGAVRLEDWGLIRASGADARSFLHGQLTQDILALAPERATLAGYCSPKGRLLATFVAWSPTADEVYLACSADLLAASLKRLSMFVLRAQCRLSDVSQSLAIWGVVGSDVAGWTGAECPVGDWQSAVGSAGTVIRLPGASPARCLVVASTPPPADVGSLDIEIWRALEVRSGIGRVVAATVDQFVPQMLNLELVGGVSFSKGCYPGQEVVARSQYRGTLKRRSFVVEVDSEARPGAEIFHSSDPGQPAGMVALAGGFAGSQRVALAELKLSALEGGTLHLESASGPAVRLAPQPYVLPPSQ